MQNNSDKPIECCLVCNYFNQGKSNPETGICSNPDSPCRMAWMNINDKCNFFESKQDEDKGKHT